MSEWGMLCSRGKAEHFYTLYILPQIEKKLREEEAAILARKNLSN